MVVKIKSGSGSGLDDPQFNSTEKAGSYNLRYVIIFVPDKLNSA
jgi:hypothetical protein